MSVIDDILKLTDQLYPSGRAFKLFKNSDLKKLHQALGLSEERAYNDALSVLDSILPDNDNFSSDDASDWERRLGMITNESVSLDSRKSAILRKMNHPGTIPARQHYLYLQGQLRSAGFDVYVHENRFFEGGIWVTKTPEELTIVDLATQMGDAQMGDFQMGGTVISLGTSVQMGDAQMGDFQMGGSFNNKIVNYIDETIDETFNVGDNLRSTFFIGGTPVGQFSSVPLSRKDEFRQLILKIKPAQTVGYLLVNYV